ncbi:MAG: hypothetical protein HC837_15265, partial [Chloroflexaceae bacterium]|nr:hypothetical protein [Chloroflexaceae bacterium]
MTSFRLPLDQIADRGRVRLRALSFDLDRLWSHWQLDALALLTLLLITLAYQTIGSFDITMNPRDRRFIIDAHELEIGNTGDWIRWTSPETRLALPLLAAHHPLILNLSLINSYPADVPDPVVKLRQDDQTLVSFAVPREQAMIRHHRMLLRPQDRAGWAMPLTIESTTFSPSE